MRRFLQVTNYKLQLVHVKLRTNIIPRPLNLTVLGPIIIITCGCCLHVVFVLNVITIIYTVLCL
jgi:hypothetical protein